MEDPSSGLSGPPKETTSRQNHKQTTEKNMAIGEKLKQIYIFLGVMLVMAAMIPVWIIVQGIALVHGIYIDLKCLYYRLNP